MSDRRDVLFQKRPWRAVPNWLATHKTKTTLLLVMLLASILVLPAWGGMPGGGMMWTWPPGGNTPYFEILAVEKDVNVTIEANRFPVGTVLNVTMGPMWTRGVNGIAVDTITVGEDPFQATFLIPAELAGHYQISIRLESDDMYPYYGFNWFYNNTALP